MANIFGKLIDRYPSLPALLANTSASKLIQLVKKNALDPAFGHEQVVQNIQSWPTPMKKSAEWILYTLSGVVRTMPEPGHPVAIALQEAFAESLTQIGIKIEEIPVAEQTAVIDAVMPVIRAQLVDTIKKDHPFRDRVDAITGTAQDWDKVIQEADDFVSRVNEKTRSHREARKARGWRRFL